MSRRRKGPTPSRKRRNERERDELRAAAGTQDSFRPLSRKRGIVSVVRVVCDKCGAAMLNPHAHGSKPDMSGPLYVVPCPFCGCETATFRDVVLVSRGHAEQFALEEAAG